MFCTHSFPFTLRTSGYNTTTDVASYVFQLVLLGWRLATGWTVRGSNPGGGEIFRTCPDRPWDPPSLLYKGYRVFPGGKERLGRDADPSPPSNAVGQERVELYLYSSYGPYGLYRASVPVQGCTLPLTFTARVGHVLAQLVEALRCKPEGRRPFTAKAVNICTDWFFYKMMHITYMYSDQV